MKKMKKNYKTRLLITLLIMVLMLFGCGNTQAETTPAPVPEEKEPEMVEETKVEEPEPEVVEDVQEETTETTETEEKAVVDEVEYIIDFGTLEEYLATKSNNEPILLIYNKSEGYIVELEDEQHYAMKKDDKLISTGIPNYDDIAFPSRTIKSSVVDGPTCQYELDYSNFEPNKKFELRKILDNGELEHIVSCYLDPPTD